MYTLVDRVDTLQNMYTLVELFSFQFSRINVFLCFLTGWWVEKRDKNVKYSTYTIPFILVVIVRVRAFLHSPYVSIALPCFHENGEAQTIENSEN